MCDVLTITYALLARLVVHSQVIHDKRLNVGVFVDYLGNGLAVPVSGL